MFLARRLVILVAAAGCRGRRSGLSRGEEPDNEPAGAGALTDGFETPQPSWEREYADTTVRLLAHDRSNRAAHGGQFSEHFQFEAGTRQPVFCQLRRCRRVPITAELGVSLSSDRTKQGPSSSARSCSPPTSIRRPKLHRSSCCPAPSSVGSIDGRASNS